jgi:hypothetical protein
MNPFLSYWISNRPVSLIPPYLSYTKTIFNPTGETSSVMFGYYFNPTDYYPMSNPHPFPPFVPTQLKLLDNGW